MNAVSKLFVRRRCDSLPNYFWALGTWQKLATVKSQLLLNSLVVNYTVSDTIGFMQIIHYSVYNTGHTIRFKIPLV